MAQAAQEGTDGLDTTSAVLGNRDVLLYLSGRFLWMSATHIITLAVGYLIYDLTRSAWALALVGLAAFAPKVVVAVISGVIADRYDRRRVIAICLVLLAAASFGMMLVVAEGASNIAAFYLLFILVGFAKGFVSPANHVLIANIVPRVQLPRAMGLSSSMSQLATILGPPLGGFLYVFGATVPFATAAAFFVVAAVLTLLIRPSPQAVQKGPVTLKDAFAGVGFIRSRPVILGAISLDMFCVLLGGATALLPMIAVEILHVDTVGLGILRAAPAVGAIALAVVLARWPIRRMAGKKLLVATTIFGLATIGLGLSSVMWLTLLCLVVIGAADIVSVVIRQTLVQGDTPDHMRGRVAAVNALFVGASNELGEFESGAAAAIFGLVPAIVLGGVGCIVISALWIVVFPALVKRDHLLADAAG